MTVMQNTEVILFLKIYLFIYLYFADSRRVCLLRMWFKEASSWIAVDEHTPGRRQQEVPPQNIDWECDARRNRKSYMWSRGSDTGTVCKSCAEPKLHWDTLGSPSLSPWLKRSRIWEFDFLWVSCRLALIALRFLCYWRKKHTWEKEKNSSLVPAEIIFIGDPRALWN